MRRRQYPDIKNILIVDFDVHHGNGTQDIFYADPSVFYYSLHQYPWYPGTGSASERGAREGEGYTLNVPVPEATPARDYMRMFEKGLESVMQSFTPDLVLVSAGFDAHVADPLGHLMLTDTDYHAPHAAAQRVGSHLKRGAIGVLSGGWLQPPHPGSYGARTRGGAGLSAAIGTARDGFFDIPPGLVLGKGYRMPMVTFQPEQFFWATAKVGRPWRPQCTKPVELQS